jgi:hypothetical protein
MNYGIGLKKLPCWQKRLLVGKLSHIISIDGVDMMAWERNVHTCQRIQHFAATNQMDAHFNTRLQCHFISQRSWASMALILILSTHVHA